VVPKSDTNQVELGEELALVISNENTVKTLVYLVERDGSPKEIANALGISNSKASHHVKKLKGLHLIELIEEKEVGGAIQHIYRAVVRPVVNTKLWEKLSVEDRQRYSVWILRMILTDASNSLGAGVFDLRPERHLSRVPMVVDTQGHSEVSAIQDRALKEIIQVEANSAERRAKSGSLAINMIAAMMCFELPEPSTGLKVRGDVDEGLSTGP
jgi:predicted transcriptional regulator